ncbi:LysM peptidoglycan-binding domain-containing protein [bacterium]|nr:LysM peptidoglycan-binding domain-containing protein [bacterium]MBU1959237.1 LysM peptidoglycan-binding domain-containing protein [bacterium]
MLNKDQYNQDEYNDYYRQEAEGAEIRSSESQDSGKSKLILFLSLIALAVAGFFGFKMLSSSETSDKSIKEITNITTQESNNIKAEPQETAQISSVETQVANAIQNNMQSSDSMSAEQIAKVVAIVMSQMKEKQSTQTTPSSNASSIDIEDDTDLMNALADTNVDSVRENTETDYSVSTTRTNTEIQSDTKKIDTYNKVTVQSTSGEDELSKLSEQINNAMDDDTATDDGSPTTNTYTTSIKKEVATRSNEMRIIVVKKGDTLGKIAQRAYGNVMDYKKIYKANPDILNRPDRIYIGQKLRIPE